MKITKRQLRRIIREEKARILDEQKVRRRLTEADWRNADGSPWTPPPKSGRARKSPSKPSTPPKSGRAGGKGFDPYDINANMGTEFFLSDENGTFDVSGNLLDPADLRRLADTLEKLFSGTLKPDGMVGFDID